MRTERILRRYSGVQWAIVPQMLDRIADIVTSRILIAREAKQRDFFGAEPPEYRTEDGVAVVPINGVIDKQISDMERHSGATDVADIRRDIDRAVADPGVESILLDVNSPGGTVPGVPELASHVAAADEEKPVFAFTDELMASAAYWISSQARGIIATGSADVGSIGVYLPVVDVSKAYENQGIVVELITAGKFKGAGFPGTTLSDEQRQDFQEGVDYIYDMFTAQVRSSRGDLPSDVLQGQTFIGQQAVDAGLVDEIGDFSYALEVAKTET